MKSLANTAQNNINMNWELGSLAREEEVSISYTGQSLIFHHISASGLENI